MIGGIGGIGPGPAGTVDKGGGAFLRARGIQHGADLATRPAQLKADQAKPCRQGKRQPHRRQPNAAPLAAETPFQPGRAQRASIARQAGITPITSRASAA